MRPEDDDEAGVEGGPPPDPSMRQWRHPSEIAAASAAAARPIEPPSSRRSGPIALTLAVTAAASLFVGVGTVVVSTFLDAVETDGSFTLDDGAGDNDGPGGEVGPGSSLLAGTLLTAATVGPSTTVPAATSTSPTPDSGGSAGIEAYQPAPHAEPPSQLEAETRPNSKSTTYSAEVVVTTDDAANARDGLFTAPEGERRRLAAFVIVNDMIVTSASAIDGNDELAVLFGGEWANATVLGRDLSHDVAVLDVAEADRTHLLDHHESLSIEPGSDNALEPGTHIRISTGDDEPTSGIVIDSNRRVVARTETFVYGTALTSARRPEGASGAAIVDDTGSLLGLVADTGDYLTAVIPIDTVIAIGEAIHEWGVPAVEWLGIKGKTMPDGGVEVREVNTDGPAAESELMPGDSIVRVDGVRVIDWEHLVHLIRRSGAGATIKVVVERDSLFRSVETTVGAKYDWTNEEPDATE